MPCASRHFRSATIATLLFVAGASATFAQTVAPPLSPAGYALRATDYIGKSVTGRDSLTIGPIEDLIIAQDRRTAHAIVSVGGFLGINGRLVAVPLGDLAPVGAKQYRLDMTKEQLAAQPEFVWPTTSSADATREQYAAAARLQVQEWELRMRDLAGRAKEKTDAGTAVASNKVNSAWENVKKQWNGLSDTTAEKWDTTKRSFETAWQEFQREWEKTGN